MTRNRTRFASLLIVAAVAGVAAAPYLGRAQSATPVGATPVASDLLQEGERIYGDVCVACHQPGGAGVEGIYPALAGDVFVTLDDPKPAVLTVIHGRGGMPRFNDIYTDEQIAAVVSYVRSAWGNNASPVDPEYVAGVRAEWEATAATPVATPEGVSSGQDPEEDQ